MVPPGKKPDAVSDDEISDFDDEFDSDVTWSDIEDDFESEVFEDNLGEEDLPSTDNFEESAVLAPQRPAKKKGSAGLFIALLVILGAAGGGGYFYFQTMMPKAARKPVVQNIPVATNEKAPEASPETSPPVQEDTAAQVNADPQLAGELPPMPDQASDGDALNVGTDENLVDSAEAEVLTPMPTMTDSDSVELSSLDDALPVDDTANAPLSSEDDGEILAMDTTEQPLSPESEDSLASASKEADLLSQTEKPFVPALEEAVPAEDDTLTLDEQLGDVVEAAVEEPQISASDVPAPAPEESAPEVVEAPVAAPEPQPEPEIAPAPAPEPEASVPVQPEPVAVPAPHVEAASQPVAKPVAPKKVEKPAPVWKLRSAQPGRAVIYDQRTDEMKTVEVGDTVAGIGKILSVSNETGKWVVRGTRGEIKQ
ncbi:MAG: hypothetical protein KDI13_10340 [Alphaproteobacteria bacterium]|nr:hypothetical protein [Alphaproteobacteria bacterium]